MLDPVFRYLTASPLTDDAFERDQLFQTILDRRVAILVGLTNTVPLALMTVYLTGATWPYAWIVVDLFLTAARWKIMIDAQHASADRRTQQGRALIVLGALWMLALGTAVHLCLASGHVPLMVISAVIGTGVAATVTSRNAATPRHALLMLMLIGVPFALGMVRSPLDGMVIAGALTIIWIASLYLFVLQNHASMLRLIKAETAARRAAETDELTGLLNRTCFEERRARLDKLFGEEANYGLLCIDLDGFKSVNDRYGHSAGDEVLRIASRRMKDNLRKGDTLFRVGGDEFVAILPNAAAHDCVAIADRIITALSLPFELQDGVRVSVGASLGSACNVGLVGISERLLHSADTAMYHAKANGKGGHIHARFDGSQHAASG